MELEKYKTAESIQDELAMLTRWTKECDHICTLVMYIKRDGERDSTTDMPVTRELSDEILELINKRIQTLEEKFRQL